MRSVQFRAEVCARDACAVAIVRDDRGRVVLERTAVTFDAALFKVLRELNEYVPHAHVTAG